MKIHHLLLTMILISFQLAAQNDRIEIFGTLVDCEDGNPVYYANVGIIGLGIGTVSDLNGEFRFSVSKEQLEHILTISRIGYETISFELKEFNPATGISIFMKPVSTQLSEINIVSNRLKASVKGYKTNSRTMVAAINSESIGAETGTMLKLSKKEGILKDINFNIVTNNPDSAIFRINIYSFEKEKTGINILKNNILFTVYRGQTGIYCIDLSDYEIVVNDNIFISIELLEIFSHKGSANLSEMASERINISVALGKGYYTRKNIFSDWELNNKRFSPGFWVTVLY